MELFPASNKKQWTIIKRVIDDSDFYLLIIAGRYGSLGIDDDGNNVIYWKRLNVPIYKELYHFL